MKLNPSNQLELFIHGKELKKLISLYKENKLPNKILLNGRKGIGKCTLAYHLINSILSENEDFAYNFTDFKIDERNKSFKLIKNGSSPNFSLVDVKTDKKVVNIDQIRRLIKDLNKSSFNEKPKFVLIDDSEYLNKNSINALLKDIEEPNIGVYFILIQNQKKLLNTLTSRFVKFNIHLSNNESLYTINKLINDNIHDLVNNEFINYYFSPGNIYKMIDFCNDNNIDFKDIKLRDFINILINNNYFKKDSNLKYLFYEILENLLKQKTKSLDLDHYNYFIKKIDIINKYNLDEESLFIELSDKILNG